MKRLVEECEKAGICNAITCIGFGHKLVALWPSLAFHRGGLGVRVSYRPMLSGLLKNKIPHIPRFSGKSSVLTTWQWRGVWCHSLMLAFSLWSCGKAELRVVRLGRNERARAWPRFPDLVGGASAPDCRYSEIGCRDKPCN
jgi:hypothetical protein